MNDTTEPQTADTTAVPKTRGTMRLHDRFFVVEEARGKLKAHMWQLAEEYDLSYAEVLTILGECVTNAATYAVRLERHGTTNKKADEA